MDYFNYHEDRLFVEDVAVEEIAGHFGTPCYLYSRATLERHWHAFNDAFGDHPHLVCYAVKANSNLALLNILARMGSGFDIVSVGELERVLAAGGQADRVVFSGVGKTAHEIRRALEVGIRCFNVESEPELARIQQIASEMATVAPVSLRVNPDVNANTHPYISTGLKENKFGVSVDLAYDLYQRIADMPNIEIKGVDCHIGSQLTELEPFIDALERMLVLIDRLKSIGIEIDHIDLGGGLGVRYTTEQPPEPSQYAKAIMQRLQDTDYEILLEPGRAIAANAGILVTTIEYVKETEDKKFAIVDAAMNDLLRPSLYQAVQQIVPVNKKSTGTYESYDVVGPVCETGDFFGKNRQLSLKTGELLAIRTSGAYGFAMSSNYNSRPRAAEVIVDGSQYFLVRHRESIASLFANEVLLPE